MSGYKTLPIKCAPTSAWVPDSASQACMICRSGFGFFNRRHHCRACGALACEMCVRIRTNVQPPNIRVCQACMTIAAAAMQAQQQQPGSPLPPGQQPYAQQPQPYAQQPQQPYPQQQQQQPYPQQQQQQQPYAAQPQPYASYPPQQPQQQPYGAPPPPPPPPQQQPYGAAPPPPGVPPDGVDRNAVLIDLAQQNEIKPIYIPSLARLYDYDVVVICDDSGSMSSPADPEDPGLSRWAELKQSMNLLLRATGAMGKAIDVYFLNRGTFHNVTSYSDLTVAFQRPPSGGTNTVRTLRQVWQDRQVARGLQRPLIVHLFTDGHPTDDNYNEDIAGFAYWLRNRPNIQQTYFSILLCTDDEEVCNMYRPLEYRVRGQYGWQGATTGIPGVDVTEDYRGELRDIRALRGARFPFSQGDYMVKCLVGAIDPAVHAVDLPPGASFYNAVRKSSWW